MYQHWFVSRQKRRLTTILPALVAFSDICVGEKWAGNTELQLKFEDELKRRSITEHGTLRARRENAGGGGVRTLFKQMKDLGLVFTEEDNGRCRLTLVAEALIKGEITFVDAMRMQLRKYQYPSATAWKGSGGIDHSFKVHPFQFMCRLLCDERLEGVLYMNEMSGIVIHYADSDSKNCYERVVDLILKYRKKIKLEEFVEDTPSKKYGNISNTFFNYLSLCQYTDRGTNIISVRSGKEADIKNFIEKTPKFFNNPHLPENYIRAYGRGKAAKDLRRFDRENILSQQEITEARIRKEYVLLAMRKPITSITSEIVDEITANTGIDEKTVEKFLIKNYSKGNINDFFASYKEMAHMGTDMARDFEIATCEVFKNIFHMRAEHVGPLGNTPDVFVESDTSGYCGIIDNKAYKKEYCINGNHLRVMEDEYIANYKSYGNTDKPLAFYTYIADSFGANMNSWLGRITRDTNVNGSAMPVDLLINLAQDYAERGYNHDTIKRIFSVNREIRLSDIQS